MAVVTSNTGDVLEIALHSVGANVFLHDADGNSVSAPFTRPEIDRFLDDLTEEYVNTALGDDGR